MKYFEDKEAIDFDHFIVLKTEELEVCLADDEIDFMIRIMDRAKQYRKEIGKEADPKYYVVNTDEKYAPAIKAVIENEGIPKPKIWVNEDSM